MQNATPGDQEVMDDTAVAPEDEDRSYDTLDEAAAALADDDDETPAEEAPDEAADEPEDAAEPPDVEALTAKEIEELRRSGLREADYTRKTQALAQERETVQQERTAIQERAANVTSAMQNLARFVQSLIPPEPSLALAQTNPGEYTRQQALRQRALAEVSQVMQMREQVAQGNQRATAADMDRLRAAEDAKLVQAMPQLSDPLRRGAFEKGIRDTGLAFGFTEQETAQLPVDHRVQKLIHYAGLGLRAEENRKAFERRVETPKAGKARPAQAAAGDEQRRAINRLRKSGSIEDALKLNF